MSSTPTDYRSPVTLSRIAMAGVAIVGALDAFAAIIGVAQILDPGRTIDLGGPTLSAWLMLQSLIALLGFAALVGAAIVFLMWLHRSYTNLPALRSESTEFTPGWAVGWWFIPFANLVKPYQAVRNLWAESDPEGETGGGFLSSIQPSAPAFLKLWWGFWLLSNLASNATGNVFDPENINTVTTSGYFFIVAGLLRITATVLAIYLIHVITERQEDRFRRVGPLVPAQPPPPPAFH